MKASNRLAPGGYRKLVEQLERLQSQISCRFVSTLWSIPKADLNKSYSLADTYEQARIAGMTGHELRMIVENGQLYCQLVKRPRA